MMKTVKTLRAKLGVALIGLLISIGVPASAAEKVDTLRIGLLPTEDAGEMVKQFKPVEQHLGKELGVKTKVTITQSYNALIEAMRAGHLDVVYVGGGQYVKAREFGMDVIPIVARVTPAFPGDTKGRTYYKSVIITRSDSGIKSLQDLKGKTFSFVSPTSTSGGIGPRFFLGKNGINPEKDFKKIYWAGTHEASFLAVINGKVDAGAMADHYFYHYRDRKMLKFSEYLEPKNVITNSELHILGAQKVPGIPMVVRGALGKEFIKKLQDAFLSLKFKGQLEHMMFMGTTLRFDPGSHKDYEDVVIMKKMAAKLKKKKK